jgi:hypothetical protein
VATKVSFREIRLSGWEPKMNDCHANVDYWVQHHPETKAARGWLFWEPNEAGQCLFMAHSVLDENGRLVDITPIDQNTPRDGLLFLQHVGSEEEFLVMKVPCSQVLYPPIAFDEWRESQLVMLPEPTDI